MEMAVTEKKSKFHYAWVILISCCVIMFATMGTVSSAMPVFTPAVVAALGVPVTAVSMYFSFRTAAMAIFQPIAERIFSKFDVRLVTSVAILFAGGGMAILSLFNQIYGWYIGAVISGIGLAFICYLLVPIVLNNWFEDKLGLAMGIALACTGLGGAVFSPLAGDFIASHGYKFAYVIISVIGMVLALPFAIFGLRTHPEEKGLEPYGHEVVLEKGKTVPQDGEPVKGMTVDEALRTPYFYFVLLTVVFVYFTASFMTDMPNFAVTQGFNIELAARVGSSLMIGIIVGKIALGWINDHFGSKWTVTANTCFAIISIICLLNSGAGHVFTFVGAFIFGFVVAGMSIIPPLIIRETIGMKEYTRCYAYTVTLGVIVSAISHPVYGRILDLTGSYFPGIYVAIGGLVITTILSWIAIERCKQKWT